MAAALQVQVINNHTAAIYIPHYWALYVHDGRGPFGPKRRGFYVWYRNPKDDPRLTNGKSPERAFQKRRLTKSEFLDAVEANERHIAQGNSPRTVPVIITKIIRKGMKPNKFFSNAPRGGMFGFKRDADQVVGEMFSAHVKSRLRPVLNLEGTVTIVI